MEFVFKMQRAKNPEEHLTPEEYAQCVELTKKMDYDTTWNGKFEWLSLYSACFLAKDDDGVIGYLLLANESNFQKTLITSYINGEVSRRYGPSPNFSIEQIVIDESYRKTGLATEMFESVLNWDYMKENCREITGEICPKNDSAIKWCKKMGFSIRPNISTDFLDATFNAERYYAETEQREFGKFASVVASSVLPEQN